MARARCQVGRPTGSCFQTPPVLCGTLCRRVLGGQTACRVCVPATGASHQRQGPYCLHHCPLHLCLLPAGPATVGASSRGGSELTGANGDAQDTAHTRGSTPGPSSQGGDSGFGPSHNRRSTSTSIKPKSKDEAAIMVSKLGSQRINNIFTHLRKICQHPLLVRHHFSDKKVSGAGRGRHTGGHVLQAEERAAL